jgi:hypothetical protein
VVVVEMVDSVVVAAAAEGSGGDSGGGGGQGAHLRDSGFTGSIRLSGAGLLASRNIHIVVVVVVVVAVQDHLLLRAAGGAGEQARCHNKRTIISKSSRTSFTHINAPASIPPPNTYTQQRVQESACDLTRTFSVNTIRERWWRSARQTAGAQGVVLTFFLRTGEAPPRGAVATS